jgi:hypothetical protein
VAPRGLCARRGGGTEGSERLERPRAGRARAASRCRTAHASCRPRGPICFRLPLNLRPARAQPGGHRRYHHHRHLITITIVIVIVISSPSPSSSSSHLISSPSPSSSSSSSMHQSKEDAELAQKLGRHQPFMTSAFYSCARPAGDSWASFYTSLSFYCSILPASSSHDPCGIIKGKRMK